MRQIILIAALAGMAMLTGCGNSSNDNNGPASVVSIAAATAALSEAVSDKQEPMQISALVETTPENTEPAVVNF